MKKLSVIFALVLAHALCAADTAYSPPVGGMTMQAAANTDTFMSPALARTAAWVGKVASVSGNDIVMAGTPNWNAGVFTTSFHYVRALSGAHAGQYFSITANTPSALTVDSAGLNLGAIVAGDVVEVVPYWTLGAFFPADSAGTAFIASASPLSRQTEVLFYDGDAVGINRATSATFFFYNGAWRKVGASAATSFDSTIIYPDVFFIQRNKAAATTQRALGRVQPGAVGTVIVADVSSKNDNYMALAFPVNVTLDGSGLATLGFTASTSPLSRKDELLWFDPAGTGINRPATATYYLYNGAWRKVGASASVDFGPSVELTAGKGFVIRKAVNGTTMPWVFDTSF